jgi:hypothetical protein
MSGPFVGAEQFIRHIELLDELRDDLINRPLRQLSGQENVRPMLSGESVETPQQTRRLFYRRMRHIEHLREDRLNLDPLELCHFGIECVPFRFEDNADPGLIRRHGAHYTQ